MKRNPWKWAVLGGALAIILIYGIELSTSGIERINGPLGSLEPSVQASENKHADDRALSDFDRVQQQKIAQLEKELEELKQMSKRSNEAASSNAQSISPSQLNERLPGMPYEVNQPVINRMADSTSGLLSSMSSEGIRLVVSIFDGLTK